MKGILLHNIVLLLIARKRKANQTKTGSKQHKTRKEQQIRTITHIMDICYAAHLLPHEFQ